MSDFDYSKHLPVLEGLGKAFEEFKHHKVLTARIKPIIQHHLPDYTISFQTEKGRIAGSSYSIRVWGKDIPYEHPVFLVWSDKEDSNPRWVAGFVNALQVSDVRDSLEREEEEAKWDQVFALLSHDVEALMRKARTIVKDLPEPVNATVRVGHPMWKNASSRLRKRFPLLFEPTLSDE